MRHGLVAAPIREPHRVVRTARHLLRRWSLHGCWLQRNGSPHRAKGLTEHKILCIEVTLDEFDLARSDRTLES